MDYEDDLEQLKYIINNQLYLNNFCTFLDADDLDWEYSHQEICEAWDSFIYDASEWIRENYPNQFALYSDWCIHLLTADYVKEKFPQLKRYIIR